MSKITKSSENCINLIKKFEGFRSNPYICPAGILTIGYGNTFYENGKKITMSDNPISEERATELLKFTLSTFEKYVDSYCRDDISQNQFDALVSFCYNLGPNSLKTSTLLKKLNVNPNDPTIVNEFKKWVKSGSKTLPGLIKRREDEASLYMKS